MVWRNMNGTHLVRMGIKDAQGRVATATSKLTVAPK